MMYPKIIEICDNNKAKAKVKSRNEFIEKAILHYVGYLHKDDNTNYLNKVIDETLSYKIDLLEEQLSAVLFKLSVETSMLMHIVAASTDIDEETLKLLRDKCTKDVKASIGKVNLVDILKKEGDIWCHASLLSLAICNQATKENLVF